MGPEMNRDQLASSMTKRCDPSNNHLKNLEYATALQNMRHAAENGLMADQRGELNGAAKLSNASVRQIRELHTTGRYLQRELAAMFGVSRPNISLVVNRKSRNLAGEGFGLSK